MSENLPQALYSLRDTEILNERIGEVIAKLDAIKEMLDSTVYGMQKMSSNLDDIMVKLDV